MEFVILWGLVVVEKIAALFSYGMYVAVFAVFVMIVWGAIALAHAKDDAPDADVVATIRPVVDTSKKYVWIGLLVWALGAVLPSQKEAAIIVGGGITYNILTSEEAKEVGGKSIQLLNKKLEEMIASEEVDASKAVQAVEAAKEIITK